MGNPRLADLLFALDNSHRAIVAAVDDRLEGLRAALLLIANVPPAGSSEVGDREESTSRAVFVAAGWAFSHDIAGDGICEDRSCFRCRLVDLLIETENGATPTEEVRQPERFDSPESSPPVAGATPVEPYSIGIAGVAERYRIVDGHLEIWFASDARWIRQVPSKWHTIDAWIEEAGRLRVALNTARAVIGLFEHEAGAAPVEASDPRPCTCKGLGRFAFQLDPNCPKHSVEASAGVATDELCIRCGKKPKSWVMHKNPPGRVCWASCVGVATDHVWHGGICKMCGEDARRVIRGEPCSNPPATGRYDEIVKELDTARVGGHWGELFDRAASALREAQQRITEQQATS